MRRGTESIHNNRLRSGGKTYRATDPDSNRLASLASMTMARQNPGLVLPSISQIPTSYTHTTGENSTLALARSLVKLDIGSRGLWERHNGNLSLFIRSSLNEWLKYIGASQLQGSVDIDLAIVDDLQGVKPKDSGNLFILLETSDGCGFLQIGKQLELLEKEQVGLGRAFYIVLTLTMNSWVDVYDVNNAESYLDNRKNSIELDMDEDMTDESFQKHCQANDISFPDIAEATPACARGISLFKESRRRNRSIKLLEKHRGGKYAEWIEPVLAMASLRKPQCGQNYQDIDFEGIWDEGPLPNWVVAFESHDPITQAFDDEGQSMNEYMHAPTWIDSFDPTDANDVKKVLNYVRNFVMVNQQIVKLSQCFEDWSKNSGSTDRSEFDDELRTA